VIPVQIDRLIYASLTGLVVSAAVVVASYSKALLEVDDPWIVPLWGLALPVSAYVASKRLRAGHVTARRLLWGVTIGVTCLGLQGIYSFLTLDQMRVKGRGNEYVLTFRGEVVRILSRAEYVDRSNRTTRLFASGAGVFYGLSLLGRRKDD
jgi:hypothetical protein